MKNKLLIMAFIILAFSAMNLFAQNFEGKITQKETSNYDGEAQETFTSTVFVNNNKICVEDGKGNRYIFSADKNVMWFVLTEQKSYIEMDMESFPSDENSEFEDEETKTVVKKTGMKKVINGFECEQVIETNEYEGSENEYWVTKKQSLKKIFSSIASMMDKFGGEEESGNSKELEAFDGIPILTITKYPGAEERSEILSIEEESVPEIKFQIPAGFKKITFEEMIQQQLKNMQDFEGFDY